MTTIFPKIQKPTASVRNSNMELLRILCGIGVIFQHFCLPMNQAAFGYVAGYMGKTLFLHLLFSFFRIAVDAFMIISGYFLCSRDSRCVGKPLTLLFMSGIYCGLSFVLRMLLFAEPLLADAVRDAFLPSKYFVSLYVTVYLLSPYLNRLVRGLTARQYRNLLWLLFLLFSAYSTLINSVLALTGKTGMEGVYTVLQVGTGRGFSIVGFVFMYLLGGYLRRYGLSLPVRWQVAGVALCIGVTALVPLACPRLQEALYNYDSAFVVTQSVLMVSIFSRLNFQSRAVNFVARSVFGVYLLHFQMLKALCDFIRMERICGAALPNMICWTAIAVGGTFLVCTVLDCCLRLIAAPFAKVWKGTGLYRFSFTDATLAEPAEQVQ